MPASNFARINLDLLYPEFRDVLFEVIAACNARGVTYIATYGYRTYGEQMSLWVKGRTVPGQIVTNARGGESAHNFGLAVDFVRDIDNAKPGVQPSWDAKDYDVLIEEAQKRGLHSGKGYKDWPHVSWPGYVSAHDLKDLDVVYRSGEGDLLARLGRVWQHVSNPNGS